MPSSPAVTSKKLRKTYAHTWDPISGITVKRAVSSLNRTQAIFSNDERAAVSSTIAVVETGLAGYWSCIYHGCSTGVLRDIDSLANVRIFLSSVRNRIVEETDTDG